MHNVHVDAEVNPEIVIQGIGNFSYIFNPFRPDSLCIVDEEALILLQPGEPSETLDPDNLDHEPLFGFGFVASQKAGFGGTRPLPTTDPRIAIWLHITNSCNLACSYCYINQTVGGMTFVDAMSSIDKAASECREKNLGLTVKFAGGEPLTRFPLIEKVVNAVENSNIKIPISFGIITNGTLLTENRVKFISEHKIGIAVSLDGDEPVNDRVRFDKKGRGSFQRIMQGLNLLKSANVGFTVMITVTENNVETLPEITKSMLDLGFRFRFSLEKSADGTVPGPALIQKRVIKSLMECYDLMEDRLPQGPLESWHTFGDIAFRRPKSRICGAGENYFAIAEDGSLAECGMALDRRYGSIHHSQSILSQVQEGSRIDPSGKASGYGDCAICPWRYLCAGGCPLLTLSVKGAQQFSTPYCAVYMAVIPRLLRLKALQMIRDINEKAR